MNCPSCKTGELTPSFLELLFRTHSCGGCGGHWILIEDFVEWKTRNPGTHRAPQADYEAEDSKNALLCPMTGRIMQKFRLSSDSSHRLDYSPSVGGVWLDPGEWEYLKEHGLADSLNQVFTAQWQASIRKEDARATFTQLYRERFGEEQYQKIKELREWLTAQPNRSDLRAYLLAEDPYSTGR